MRGRGGKSIGFEALEFFVGGFALEAGSDEKPAVWKQIAYEGEWKGAQDSEGEPATLKLDRAAFLEAQRNLRANPAYKPGAEKASAADIVAGKHDVIQYDWRHLSARDPAVSPVENQIAFGWVLDVELRDGTDPKTGAPQVQFWALSRFIGKMREWISTGAVKWTSMVIGKRKNRVTNQPQGWTLGSIAMTNTPFIEGMDAGCRVALEANGFDLDSYSTTTPEGQGPLLEEGSPGPMPLSAHFLRLCKARGLTVAPTDDDGVAVHQLEAQLATGDAAVTQRDGLLKQVGGGAPGFTLEAAPPRIVEMARKASAYDAVLPRVDAYERGMILLEAEQAEADVDRVVVELGMPESAVFALEAFRTGSVDAPPDAATSEQRGAFIEARKASRGRFLAKYPLPVESERHLSADFVGEVSAARRTKALEAAGSRHLLENGAGGAGGERPRGRSAPGIKEGGDFLLELNGYQGRNTFEKVKSYIAATDKTADWTNPALHDELCKRTSKTITEQGLR